MQNGGFPPIYLCDKKQIESQKRTENREYKSQVNALSIRDIIMNKIKK